MPYFATHHIFAATVQRVTGESAARIAAAYPAGYRWGAQGADLLAYYHAPMPDPLARLARRLHSAPAGALFEALCEAAVQRHDTAALAYVFGFCTHYALDRVTHAFLEAQADRLALFHPAYSAAARRRMVENDIDGVMIADYISADPASFEAFRLLDPHAAECTVAARVLADAARQTCGVRLSPAAVYRAMHDMRRMLHLAHSGVPLRGRLARFERFAGGKGFASSLLRPAKPHAADCANRSHRPWAADGAERTESFFDLFDAAVPLAVSLQRAVLERYYQAKPLDSRFFPTDFYGKTIKN